MANQQKNILIVEDDLDIARIMIDHLRKEDYSVTWASTGKEGWEDFKQATYDIVLVDVMLPEMDGFTLCQTIRLESEVPIIIVSAKHEDESKVHGLDLGADDYLTKPFSLKELSARVNQLLCRRRHDRLSGRRSNRGKPLSRARISGRKRMVIQDDKKNDIHSTALNGGEKLISYVKGEDTALSLDFSEEEPLPVSTMKEQVTSMIDTLKTSHDYEIEGEEKVLGMDTYHMVFTAKEDDSIFEDTEFWVDKETWFVVKSVAQTADMKTESIYTKVDFSPDFDENTFVLDIPDHVDVQNMEDINPTSTGSVADVEAAMEQPFLI